jgi:hypothetical protein
VRWKVPFELFYLCEYFFQLWVGDALTVDRTDMWYSLKGGVRGVKNAWPQCVTLAQAPTAGSLPSEESV